MNRFILLGLFVGACATTNPPSPSSDYLSGGAGVIDPVKMK